VKTAALLARKGGAGKTTVAIHLGVLAHTAGERVVFFDLDPQRSLALWWQNRAADSPSLVETDARRLPDLLREAAAEGYDFAVVDTPPAVTFDTARVAGVADLVLIPLRPSLPDLYAVEGTRLWSRRPGPQPCWC
jgi:chromosome partitioning protein